MTVCKALALPLPYAGLLVVFTAFDVPWDQGLESGLVVGTALAAIIVLSPSWRDPIAAAVAIVVASAVGVPFYDPCTPISLIVAVPIGWAVFRLLSPRPKPARNDQGFGQRPEDEDVDSVLRGRPAVPS